MSEDQWKMNEETENHIISITCTAPVNIAFVKYCKLSIFFLKLTLEILMTTLLFKGKSVTVHFIESTLDLLVNNFVFFKMNPLIMMS